MQFIMVFFLMSLYKLTQINLFYSAYHWKETSNREVFVYTLTSSVTMCLPSLTNQSKEWTETSQTKSWIINYLISTERSLFQMEIINIRGYFWDPWKKCQWEVPYLKQIQLILLPSTVIFKIPLILENISPNMDVKIPPYMFTMTSSRVCKRRQQLYKIKKE